MQIFTQDVYIFTHKARRVVDQIHESSYVKTLILLELVPYRPYYPFLNYLIHQRQTPVTIILVSTKLTHTLVKRKLTKVLF